MGKISKYLEERTLDKLLTLGIRPSFYRFRHWYTSNTFAHDEKYICYGVFSSEDWKKILEMKNQGEDIYGIGEYQENFAILGQKRDKSGNFHYGVKRVFDPKGLFFIGHESTEWTEWKWDATYLETVSPGDTSPYDRNLDRGDSYLDSGGGIMKVIEKLVDSPDFGILNTYFKTKAIIYSNFIDLMLRSKTRIEKSIINDITNLEDLYAYFFFNTLVNTSLKRPIKWKGIDDGTSESRIRNILKFGKKKSNKLIFNSYVKQKLLNRYEGLKPIIEQYKEDTNSDIKIPELKEINNDIKKIVNRNISEYKRIMREYFYKTYDKIERRRTKIY